MTNIQDLNIDSPSQQQRSLNFNQFLTDNISGLVEAYTNDSVVFYFLTGIALSATSNKAAQKVGRGLMGYATLMQVGAFVGSINQNLHFIGAVIRDNPFFTEKIQELNGCIDSEREQALADIEEQYRRAINEQQS